LDEHMKNCARLAARFAEGLPERVRRTIERAAATHDLGKADPRFQAWLRGGNPVRPDELIAKSNRNGQNRAAIRRARELSGYPKGGRHELTSTALLLARGEGAGDLDGDLLLHLVASHHGRCRPFAPVVDDEEPVVLTHAGLSVSSKHELERVGSGVSERFWRLTKKYGWYGLAYLETLVRLADQRQSEAERDAGKAAHA
jgi:CRISPR-associated endonuclease/helicase Cas3